MRDKLLTIFLLWLLAAIIIIGGSVTYLYISGTRTTKFVDNNYKNLKVGKILTDSEIERQFKYYEYDFRDITKENKKVRIVIYNNTKCLYVLVKEDDILVKKDIIDLEYANYVSEEKYVPRYYDFENKVIKK